MEVGALTDIGRTKQVNQDYIYVSEGPIGPLDNVFIVADGMGGHRSGDIASRFMTETLVEALKAEAASEREPESLLYSIIRKADQQLIVKANSAEELAGMGTTLVIVTIKDGEVIVGNVGDSRLYLLSDRLRQVTEDHSRVMEMVRSGSITPEEAETHPDKNKITRAIGYGGLPDFYRFDVHPGDVLLICTDGLTNMVRHEVLEEVLRDGSKAQEQCKRLVGLANENGGMDNISVMIIKL